MKSKVSANLQRKKQKCEDRKRQEGMEFKRDGKTFTKSRSLNLAATTSSRCQLRSASARKVLRAAGGKCQQSSEKQCEDSRARRHPESHSPVSRCEDRQSVKRMEFKCA